MFLSEQSNKKWSHIFLINDVLWIEVFYEWRAGSDWRFFLYPYRDDNRKTISYYAFDTIAQRDMFEKVLKISWIGAKDFFFYCPVFIGGYSYCHRWTWCEIFSKSSWSWSQDSKKAFAWTQGYCQNWGFYKNFCRWKIIQEHSLCAQKFGIWYSYSQICATRLWWKDLKRYHGRCDQVGDWEDVGDYYLGISILNHIEIFKFLCYS